MNAQARPLPADLEFAREHIQSLVRLQAVMGRSSAPARQGDTRTFGAPDIPADASWTFTGDPFGSYHDGEIFWCQLNLAEIPPGVLPEGVPSQGVVWMFLDLSSHWNARVEFDARPASQIPWKNARQVATGCAWRTRVSYPDAEENVLGEIYWVPELLDQYGHWLSDVEHVRDGEAVVGGYLSLIQCWEPRPDQVIVMAWRRQHFGDHGALSLLYDRKTGVWSASVETH